MPRRSPLDDIIGMGDRELTTTALTAAFTDADELAAALATLGNLGYVIPPTGANCGLGAPPAGTTDAAILGMQASFVTGYDENGDGMYDGANDVAPRTSIPADVADGYSKVLDAFIAAYGDPGVLTDTGTAGALADAQKALSDAIENGQSGAALTPLQNAVTNAQERHDNAKAAFNAIAQGPIYQAGVMEWMAKAAVTQSIDNYNMAVQDAAMAKATLDALPYGSYVPACQC